uniref:Uncharacterized protein n=3 Tax=Aegilops tauschii subsp. strangulata TaxID=200361 RepID=A0A452Z5A6_AEGTS
MKQWINLKCYMINYFVHWKQSACRCCCSGQGSLRGQGDSPGEDNPGICRATWRHCHCAKIGTSFDTLGEAYNFYNLYSWEKGFGIRYGKSRMNVNWTKCMQEIVCGSAV